VFNQKLAVAAVAAVAASVAWTGVANAQARDQIRIVGSSTVFPFTTGVAEQFGRTTQFRAPIVESTGTGGGMRLFCGGVGPAHPDMTNASRRMTEREFDTCVSNGVTDIVEIKVGFDGIVLATRRGGTKIELTRENLWRALAKTTVVDGRPVENTFTTWNQVDPSYPAVQIMVMGPPPTSGTRDAFNELVMEAGCQLPRETENRGRVCTTMREDGRYVEAGENDNLIVQRLSTGGDGAFGIFGYSFLDENRDTIEGKTVDGVEPEFDNIATGEYPIARDLYVYVKEQHIGVIPGMREFIAEYVSDRAMGEGGYLEARGLIPLETPALREVQERVRTLANLTKADLAR